MDIKSSIDLKTSRYTEYNLLGNNKYEKTYTETASVLKYIYNGEVV